jgi:hypothetical protein
VKRRNALAFIDRVLDLAAALTVEARCSAYPALCDSRSGGRACGKHRLQFVTELGEEVAEEWLRPYGAA